MPIDSAARRIDVLGALIPPPPLDVAPLQILFAELVSRQWQAFVPGVLPNLRRGMADSEFAKARFISEMYARACYSMLMVSAHGPELVRCPVRATALLPQSRALTLRLGRTLLVALERLLPKALHRQLLLTSALMGMLDIVLDQAAILGEAAALRVFSSIAQPALGPRSPAEQYIAKLAAAARHHESAWQSEYWEKALLPAVRDYCLAEVLAVQQVVDPAGMGHRWPGIEAAIKGMWYVVGPYMGLQVGLSQFNRSQWTREQQWMADTSLLMQMIDDWVDQDEDRGVRITPVATGSWGPQSVAALYSKTVDDLRVILNESRVLNPIAQDIFVDLYKDYLHAAMRAMRSGVAA